MSLIFLARCWISHYCFRVRRPPVSQCLQGWHHAILHQKKSWWMVFPAKPTASQEASPTKYPVLIRCSYKVLRALPDTCQVLRSHQLPNSSTCSCLFLCTLLLSIHLVNKYLSHLIWWTPLSPANSTRPWLPRTKQRTMATSRLCNTCFQKASISMWRLRPPLPCTWRRPPLNHDTFRRPNVSVQLKIFLLCCILVGRGGWLLWWIFFAAEKRCHARYWLVYAHPSLTKWRWTVMRWR